jgi:uncharacterized protein YeaO (DUF488 family)
MSPLHGRDHSVDRLIADSQQLRAQLLATVDKLDEFVAAFAEEVDVELEQEPGDGSEHT